MLEDYYIGDLEEAGSSLVPPALKAAPAVAAPTSPNCAPQPREDDLVALNPKKKVRSFFDLCRSCMCACML